MNTFWLTLYFSFTRRLIVPIYVVYLLDIGFRPAQIAFVLGLSFFSSVLLEFPSGAIADTIGHRKTLVIAALFISLSGSLLLVSTFYGVITSVIAFAAGYSLLSGTFSAYIYESLTNEGKEETYSKVMGTFNGFSNAISIVEVALLGWLYTISPNISILITAVQPALAAFIMLRMKESPTLQSVKKKEGFSELIHHFSQAVHIFKSNPLLLRMSILSSLIVSFSTAGADFEQAILQFAGFSVTTIGIVYSIKRIGSTLISFLGGSISRIGPSKFFVLQGAVLIGFLAGMGYGSSIITLTIAATLGSICFALYRVVAMNFINQIVPSGSRATTISLSSLVWSLFVVIELSVFGWVAEKFTYVAGFQVFTVLAVVLVPFVFFWYKKSTY